MKVLKVLNSIYIDIFIYIFYMRLLNASVLYIYNVLHTISQTSSQVKHWNTIWTSSIIIITIIII